MIAEEMRVLYVALTRAEEKLILTATVPDFEKTSKNWLQVAKEKETILPASTRAKAKCYLDWIETPQLDILILKNYCVRK